MRPTLLLLILWPSSGIVNCFSFANTSRPLFQNSTFLADLQESYIAELNGSPTTSNITFESLYKLQRAFSNLQNCDFYRDIIEYSASLSQIAYCINEANALRFYPDRRFKFPDELLKKTSIKYWEQYNGTCRYQLVKILENQNHDDRYLFLGGGEGYILLDHKFQRISIVFRGSRYKNHWLTNFTFLPIRYHFILNDKWYRDKLLKYQDKETREEATTSGILDDLLNHGLFYIHKGFFKVAEKVMDDIMESMIEYLELYPCYQIFIMGHSLGGAISQIISLELANINVNHMAITFNSPSLFSNDLSCHYDGLMDTYKLSSDKLEEIGGSNRLKRGSIRVFHRFDVVPYISPRLVYRHVGYGITVQKRDFPHKLHDFFHIRETYRSGEEEEDDDDDGIDNDDDDGDGDNAEINMFVLAQYYDEMINSIKKTIRDKIDDTYYFHRHIVVFFSACNRMTIDE